MHISWRTAMSMDGRIASGTESLDFLDLIAGQEEAMADFPAFIASVDAIIVGAGTLRWLLRGGHGWPHGDRRTWLVSHDADLVRQVGPTAEPFHRHEGDVAALVRTMADAGCKRVWLSGGGDLAGQLLAIDALDEIELTVAPVALAAGSGLFGTAPLPLRAFDLADVRRLTSNTALLRYVRKAAD